MSLAENRRFRSLSEKAEKFFYSDIYIALITMIGIVGFVFKQEIYAIYAIAIITSASWIFSRDLMPTFISVAIIAMTPLSRYAEVNFFDPVYYIPIIIVPALIFHFIVFPPKIKINKFFFTTLAVAVAVTVGGLFYLSAKEYFSMPALYYVFGLGFGMVLLYLILQSDIPYDKAKIAEYFAKMMTGIGLMGIIMVASNYIKYGDLIDQSFHRFMGKFQWGNNLSNNLLLTMPFTFYLATRGKNSVFYFILGILQYAAMVLCLSRGGMIFSTMMFPFALAATVIIAKKERWKFLIALLIIIGLAVLIYFLWISPIFKDLFDILEVRENEARVNLYKLAWENFLKHPAFGTGLAYDGGMYYRPQAMCIYWYHSTIFQILGSLGIVGLLAYGYQEIVRFFTLVNVKSCFNLFALLSITGFAAYSMVNVGYFVPLPFMAMVLHMFIVIDRYNHILKNNSALMLSEKILKAN